MPTYTFTDTIEKKTWTELMSIAEMEELLVKNKHIEIGISAPALVDPYSVGRVKAPSRFRDLLGQIKKSNRGSTVDSGNLTSL